MSSLFVVRFIVGDFVAALTGGKRPGGRALGGRFVSSWEFEMSYRLSLLSVFNPGNISASRVKVVFRNKAKNNFEKKISKSLPFIFFKKKSIFRGPINYVCGFLCGGLKVNR